MKRSFRYYFDLLQPLSCAKEKFRNGEKNKVFFFKRTRIKRCRFEGHNSIGRETLVYDSSFGEGTYVSEHATLISMKIGRYCSIGSHVHTCLGNHPTTGFVSTHPAFHLNTSRQIGFTFHEEPHMLFDTHKYLDNSFEVIVENDVWIGSDARILAGVRIGNGAVIAAGAVVTKDVEPYTIVAGVPARLIKKRFSPEQIEFLENYKWWDKDFEWIKANYLKMNDIDTFIKNHETPHVQEKV